MPGSPVSLSSKRRFLSLQNSLPSELFRGFFSWTENPIAAAAAAHWSVHACMCMHARGGLHDGLGNSIECDNIYYTSSYGHSNIPSWHFSLFVGVISRS